MLNSKLSFSRLTVVLVVLILAIICVLVEPLWLGFISVTVFIAWIWWRYFLLEKLNELRTSRRVARWHNIYDAARAVHETRKATADFFERNPHESFATPRGKEMLLHHTRIYERYLSVLGKPKTVQGQYKDAYWAQLKALDSSGSLSHQLPSLPPVSDTCHSILHVAR